MTHADKPNTRSKVLVDLFAGVPIPAWGHTSMEHVFYADLPHEIVRLMLDNAALDRVDTVEQVGSAVDGAWCASGQRVYVRAPAGVDITKSVVMPIVRFCVANMPLVYEGRYYEPAISSIPKLSMRIPRKFDGIGQIGGGTLVVLNVDAWFDLLDDLSWEAGECNIYWALDLQNPDGTWDESSNYVQLGSWRIESWARTTEEASFELVEKKATLEQQLPLRTYTREEFPGLSSDDIGEPIPIAYGLVYGGKAVLIDPERKRYKLTDHAIFDVLEVRTKSSKRRRIWNTVENWQHCAPKVWRSYVGNDIGLESVSWGGPAKYKGGNWNNYFAPTTWKAKGGKLKAAGTLEDVEDKAGQYFLEDGWLYVRPKDKHLELSQCTVWVETNIDDQVYTTITPTRVDRAKGEFELGGTLGFGEVSVDFVGKVNDAGQPIVNPADVAEDIFKLVKETNYNVEAIARGRAWWRCGHDATGRELSSPSPSIYLRDLKKVADIFTDLCKATFAYFYSDGEGRYTFEPFVPKRGSECITLDDYDVTSEPEKGVDTKDIYSKVIVKFALRDAESWNDSVVCERKENQIQNGNLVTDPVEVTVPFSSREDAKRYGDRLLVTDAQPETVYTLQLEKRAMLLLPGSQFRWRSERAQEDHILEVFEIEIDPLEGDVEIRATNRRGWYDSFGFWMDDNDPNWDKAESFDSKTERWQNAGYWLGLDNQCDTADRISHGVSRLW